MFGPMSQREVLAAGGATSADTMHLVLSAATGLFVAAYVATTAFAFGWVFRLYSVVTIATALVFGLLSAQVDKIEAGDPRPTWVCSSASASGRGCCGWRYWPSFCCEANPPVEQPQLLQEMCSDDRYQGKTCDRARKPTSPKPKLCPSQPRRFGARSRKDRSPYSAT